MRSFAKITLQCRERHDYTCNVYDLTEIFFRCASCNAVNGMTIPVTGADMGDVNATSDSCNAVNGMTIPVTFEFDVDDQNSIELQCRERHDYTCNMMCITL